jgi:transposase
MTTQRYTRFCGIDIGKGKHAACVMDRDGQFVMRSQSFTNDAQGYQAFLNRLQDAGSRRTSGLLVGLEATGHYWYALRDFLVGKDYDVVVLNPLQTKQQGRRDIRKCKTDRVDARRIARLLKTGEYRVSLVPGDFAMTCRHLTRLRCRLIGQRARIKLWLRSRLEPIWPEYEALMSNPFCKTGRTLLMKAPAPEDVVNLGREELFELIRKTSRGKFGPVKAEQIWNAACNTIGTRRGIEGARIAIRSLLTQLETLAPIREQLETEIETLARRLPGYLFTLPGIDTLTAVSLFGETDPIETFDSGAQLVAFAGLDTTVFQTGQYEAKRRRITKRGSPYLRHTLWSIAHRACRQEGDLRDYCLRRRREGLHYKSAVTATAIKLCHVAWRILTDQRDYLPVPPSRTIPLPKDRKQAS